MKRHHSSPDMSAFAFDAAQSFALELKEMIKTNGLDPRGVNVVPKKYIKPKTRCSPDAQVQWKNGPSGWAKMLDLHDSEVVSVIATAPDTVSFWYKSFF